jgi:phosphate transport system substrate-binding protein
MMNGRALAGTAAAVVLALLSTAASAQTEIRVKGSSTIGALLGPDWTRAYTAEHPDVRIRWESLGSSTAFVGLFDGSADLGVSARAVRPEELADARRLQLKLSEYTIGLDAVAIIVHPSNSVAQLSFAQLADLFAGRAKNWRAVGGPNLAVDLLSLPTYSGTHALFADRVLHRGNSPADSFSSGTHFSEQAAVLVQQVANDPGAVAYVGMGFTRTRNVKTIALSERDQKPLEPTVLTIRDGSYPLHRALYLYSRGEPAGPLREFVAWLLGPKGQALVARGGMIPRDGPPPALLTAAAEEAAPTEPANRVQAPLRIVFRSMSTALSNSDRQLLDPLVAPLIQGGQRLLITGHADGVTPRENNPRYSQERAEVVAAYLRQKGVPAAHLEVSGRAETEPVATNQTESGRRLNRRVDLRLIAAPIPARPTWESAPAPGGAPR